MTEGEFPPERNGYIERLRAARGGVAVLKIQLMSFRSHSPLVPIFAFEGVDDKIIYFQWVQRVRPGLDYEPFPCSGKQQVFQLREMVFRDLGGLSAGMYFLVDRDFDDMQGNVVHENTFMTERYSTDNYLVCEEVLNEFLRIEFHCHARPDVRQNIVNLFTRVYDEFLSETKEINFRLFAGKIGNLTMSTHVPERVIDLARVELDRVVSLGIDPREKVAFEQEPTEEELAVIRQSFDAFPPRDRYRGKFAYLFFFKWLGMLAEAYSQKPSPLFDALGIRPKVKQSEIVLGAFAARSPLPEGLPDFLARVT